jgi:menaquinone-dependent protoporphyrinogen IX oxidase
LKMKILIAYATNSGTTEDVVRVIAEELGKDGSQVDVRRIEEVSGVESYQAAIIGAPMILGWHRAAAGFVRKHQQALSRIPVAYFITAMSLTRSPQETVGMVPIFVDEGLAKAPKNPKRLSLKERYTSLKNYAGQPLRAAPQVAPVSIGIFGGKLEMYRLNLLQALFVMLILRVPMGSRQNLPAARQWACQLSNLLTARQGV